MYSFDFDIQIMFIFIYRENIELAVLPKDTLYLSVL